MMIKILIKVKRDETHAMDQFKINIENEKEFFLV